MASLLGEKNTTYEGEITIDGKIPGATRKQWKIVYYVKADVNETEDDVLVCSGLPIMYEIYRNGYCIGKAARETTVLADGGLWEVTCRFDSHIPVPSGGGGGEGTPVIDYWWDLDEIEQEQRYDAISGKPIKNSAGEPIQVMSPLTIAILNIVRIETYFAPTNIFLYNNHVNSKPFLGAPSRCALMSGPTAKRKLINNVYFWEVTYKIKFNMRPDPSLLDENDPTTISPGGWYLFLLDYGTRYISYSYPDPDTGVWIDVFKSFTTDEEKDEDHGNLDGFGLKLPQGFPEVYLKYNRYPVADFDLLNFGL